jgi:hypothetical protein
MPRCFPDGDVVVDSRHFRNPDFIEPLESGMAKMVEIGAG